LTLAVLLWAAGCGQPAGTAKKPAPASVAAAAKAANEEALRARQSAAKQAQAKQQPAGQTSTVPPAESASADAKDSQAPAAAPASPNAETPVVATSTTSSADDGRSWAHWRGPGQIGVSGNRDLPESWSLDGTNLLWTKPYGGRSCPLVMNGRVYIIGAAGSGIETHERVACFDAETGAVLWEYPFNVFYTDIVANRVGWANLAGDPETGYVYAHGVQDLMLCLDADGKLIWSHSLNEEYGSVTGYGGRIHTPVVDEDRVIISFLSRRDIATLRWISERARCSGGPRRESSRSIRATARRYSPSSTASG
jgi:hypothetical protein